MISKDKASRLADDIVAAERAEWPLRSAVSHSPVPSWFKGPHLAGLDQRQRLQRWDELFRRVQRRRDWMLVSIAVAAAIMLPLLLVAHVKLAAVIMVPAVCVMLGRHVAMRRELRRDVRDSAAPSSGG